MGEFRDSYSPEPVNLNDAIQTALDEESYMPREVPKAHDNGLAFMDENGNMIVKTISGDPKPYHPDPGSELE